MLIRLHGNATATPAKRAYIYQNRHRSTAELQRELGLGYRTVVRWKERPDGQDGSSRPHRMHASLADWQEKLVVELRTTMLLPLDDLLAVVRKVMKPTLTRSALNRCLVRHGAGSLRALRARLEDKPSAAGKRFKDYASGFLHVDIKYLPRMSDETRHRYLFVAIDRATRWVHAEILADKSARSAAAFVARLTAAFPGKIYRILTDNGKEFSDRFTRAGERTPTGRHLFDRKCRELGIDHRLIPVRRPQTNGMVERFNGRIAEILRNHHFHDSRQLSTAIRNYLHSYNHIIAQRSLGHRTPAQALGDQINKPILPKCDR